MTPETFTIELPENPSEVLALAAEELSRYVPRLTGQAAAPSSAEAAHVFRLRVEDMAIFLGTLPMDFGEPMVHDGFRIRSHASVTEFVAPTEKGVLNAVYFFLERTLGVRWVEPGEIGEVPPPGRTRTWWPLNIVEAPAFEIRGMHVTENTQWYREQDLVSHLEWMARVRLNRIVVYSNYSYERLRPLLVRECRRRGITLEVEIISHNQFLPMELFDAHPEYFPVVDGARTGRSFVQRCAASREAVGHFVKAAAAWVREHPEADVVSLMSNDGRGYCECEHCASMKPNEQWSKFLYPALAALRAAFPQRRFASRAYCYRYDPLPGDAELRLGDGLMFDTFIRCRWHEIGSPDCPVETRNPECHDASKGATGNVYLLNVLHEWKDLVTGPLYVFDNIAQHGLLSVPTPNPEVLSRDIETYRRLGLSGMIVLGHVHSFGSYVLNFNLFARKAWDISANYRGLWPDLAVRYFGGYGIRVMDFIERMRAVILRGGYCFGLTERLAEADWRDIQMLLGPSPQGSEDLFSRRYRRVRQSFYYMRALSRLGAAGKRLRAAREAHDRDAARAAVREGLARFLEVWDILDFNRDKGVFDTIDIKAKMLVRNLNGEALAERFDWAARPFWQDANPDRQRIFWDYLAHLEEEGMSIEDVYAKLDEEFARAREGVAALADHVDELAEVIEFR